MHGPSDEGEEFEEDEEVDVEQYEIDVEGG